MSADNTIALLHLVDQSRVIEITSAENLYWCWQDTQIASGCLNWAILYENFCKEPPLSYREACALAYQWEADHFVEYGIQEESWDYTWQEVIILAQEQAEKDIETLRKMAKENERMAPYYTDSTTSLIKTWLHPYLVQLPVPMQIALSEDHFNKDRWLVAADWLEDHDVDTKKLRLFVEKNLVFSS